MSKFKKILFISLAVISLKFILTATEVYSQSVVWRQILYGGPYIDEAYNCIKLNDGGYAATGLKQVPVQGKPGMISYVNKAFIIKFDRYGNVLWDKNMGDSLTGTISKTITQDSLGNIYLPYTSIKGFRLAKLDINGNILWDKLYSNAQIYSLKGVSFTDNYRNLVMLSLNVVLGFNTTSGITKIDSSGNFLWTKAYYDSIPTYSYYTSHNNSFFFSDNSYYICGVKGVNPFIIKTDTSGNIIWNKRYLTNQGLYSIAQNSENTFLAAGRPADNSPLYIMSFDSSGAVLLDRNLHDSLSFNIGWDGIVKNFENNFVLGVVHSDNVGRLLIIDSLGNVMSSKYYYYPPGFYIDQNNVNNTSDSGYIIAGALDSDNVLQNYQSGQSQRNILIFKTDKYGKTVSIFNHQTKISEDIKIDVFPNPYNLSFSISFEINSSSKVRLLLYDLSGKLIKQISNKDLNAGNYKYNVSTPELSSGVYFVKMETNIKSYIRRILLIK